MKATARDARRVHFGSKQRSIILDFLRSTDEHPTAEEIRIQLKKKLASMGLGTIYRNLKYLHDHGYIEEVWTADHVAHYSGRVDAHFHFRCEHCGRIDEFDMSPAAQEQKDELESKGYKIRDGAIQYTGLCKRCANENEFAQRILCHAYGKFRDELPKNSSECAQCTFQATCQYHAALQPHA